MAMQQHADLTSLNTFGIAAKADRLARFDSVDGLRELLSTPAVSQAPVLILGGGSNILFTHDF